MDSLVAKFTPAAVKKALQTLPQEAYGAYDDTMERIEMQRKDEVELAKKALAWIVYARRLLSATELRHALAIMPGMEALDLDDLVDNEIWISLCAGLVVIDDHNVVRLVRKYNTLRC